MLEPNDFFQNQAKQCRSQADSTANKSDREFWLQLAHRWERLLQAGGARLLPPANAVTGPGTPRLSH